MGKYPPAESWPGSRFGGSPRQEVPEESRLLVRSVIERLEKAIPGEKSAYLEYMSIARDAEHAGMLATALIVGVMAQEEKQHLASLEEMAKYPEPK